MQQKFYSRLSVILKCSLLLTLLLITLILSACSELADLAKDTVGGAKDIAVGAVDEVIDNAIIEALPPDSPSYVVSKFFEAYKSGDIDTMQSLYDYDILLCPNATSSEISVTQYITFSGYKRFDLIASFMEDEYIYSPYITTEFTGDKRIYSIAEAPESYNLLSIFIRKQLYSRILDFKCSDFRENAYLSTDENGNYIDAVTVDFVIEFQNVRNSIQTETMLAILINPLGFAMEALSITDAAEANNLKTDENRVYDVCMEAIQLIAERNLTNDAELSTDWEQWNITLTLEKRADGWQIVDGGTNYFLLAPLSPITGGLFFSLG
jgi:hypothetical protein